MREKVVKILIAYDDPTILQYLVTKISKLCASLNVYAQFITSSTFKETKKIIERYELDIPFVGFNWENEDGTGADLVELIRKKSPQQLIVAILENQNSRLQLKNPDKYYPIMYPTRDLFFSELDYYLKQALESLPDSAEKFVIDTHAKVIQLDLAEIAYVYGNGGKVIIFVYDFESKSYEEIEVPMTLTRFLEGYNRSNTFIKCHRNYAVNKRVIRFVHKSREHQCIELIYSDERDYPVEIPMSDSFKKLVLRAMEGVDSGWQK